MKPLAALLAAALLSAPLIPDTAEARGGRAHISSREDLQSFLARDYSGRSAARPGPNAASVHQQGSGNGAAIRQSGEGNTAGVRQFGRDNTGVVTQTGNDNAACLIQFGRNLDGAITQTGGQTTGVIQTRKGVREVPVELCDRRTSGRAHMMRAYQHDARW